MNSLADILSDRADDLFSADFSLDDTAPTSTAASAPAEEKKDTAAPSPSVSSTAPLNPQTARDLETMIHTMKRELDTMLRLLQGGHAPAPAVLDTAGPQELPGGERVLEGSFTGDKMLGSDGKEYAVPPNYASKSKLVPGDKMKLTITRSGSFIYKQIGPIERRRVIGELVFDASNNQWSVLAIGKTYRVLTASVTFYHGKSGDEAVLLLPMGQESIWGTVDNIINK